MNTNKKTPARRVTKKAPVRATTRRPAKIAAKSAKVEKPAKARTTRKATATRRNNQPTAPAPKAIRDVMTQAEVISMIAEQKELDAKTVKAVIESFEQIIQRSLMPRGAGEFTIRGVVKLSRMTKKVAAIRKGALRRNPATGEEFKHEGRPASTKIVVKARPLAAVKNFANGEV